MYKNKVRKKNWTLKNLPYYLISNKILIHIKFRIYNYPENKNILLKKDFVKHLYGYNFNNPCRNAFFIWKTIELVNVMNTLNISRLKHVHYLHVNNVYILDISTLKHLKYLRVTSPYHYCNIINGLKSSLDINKDLKTIILEEIKIDNKIQLKNIEVLKFHGCNFKDVKYLDDITPTALYIDNCEGFNTKNLSSFKSIKGLSLISNDLITKFKCLSNLSELILYECNEIEKLIDMKRLKKLALYYCEKIEILELSNLQLLNIKSCKNIKNLDSLRNLVYIKIIECNNFTYFIWRKQTKRFNIKDCKNFKSIDLSDLKTIELLKITGCNLKKIVKPEYITNNINIKSFNNQNVLIYSDAKFLY